MKDEAKEIDLALVDINRAVRTLPRHAQLIALGKAYSQCLLEAGLNLAKGQAILGESYRIALGISPSTTRQK